MTAALQAAAAAEGEPAATERARAAEDRAKAAADREAARLELALARGVSGAEQSRMLVARLRRDVDADLNALRGRLDAAEQELEDLRVIRDALTPPDLPTRPGLALSAAFLPAANRVSGDFYLVAEGPDDSTILVVGDVAGHEVNSARRASFVRTAFVATAPFSDDPARVLAGSTPC